MDKNEILKRIREEEDFVRYPKLGNSLTKFLDANPDGVKNDMISRVLMMTEQEVEALFEDAVKRLRVAMGIK